MLTRIALLALAGALGTLARSGTNELAARITTAHPAAATFAVNMLGALLFGLITGLAGRGLISVETRLILLTGFMGAFTTFSTLAWETGDLARTGHPAWAAANMLGSAVLGTALAMAGCWLGGAASGAAGAVR